MGKIRFDDLAIINKKDLDKLLNLLMRIDDALIDGWVKRTLPASVISPDLAQEIQDTLKKYKVRS